MTTTKLESRVGIVTGAGRGIGLAIAKELSKHGVSIIAADHGGSVNGSQEDHTMIAEISKTLTGPSLSYNKNVASKAAADELVAMAVEEFGRIDIIINCAAILRDGLVFKGSTEDWDIVIKNNLSSAYYLTRAATPAMRQQFKNNRAANETYDWGRILHIGSTAGLYGNFGQANYGSAKAGLFGLMRVTALEMSRSNVTCNYIAPFARSRVTEIIEPANDEQAEYKERALKISPKHVAKFVTYLCSLDASNITGQIFGVRGREIFLFNQPRPIASIVSPDGDWTIEDLTVEVDKSFAKSFTGLETDLEAFNSEPVV